MSVRFFYIDESHDDQKLKFCLTAFSIRHIDWSAALKVVQAHRKSLRDKYGVKLAYELHATELVGGRGRPAGKTRANPSRYQRSMIFKGTLQTLAALPAVSMINVALRFSDHVDAELVAWERLLTRIDTFTRKQEDAYRAKLLGQWTSANPSTSSMEIFKEMLAARAGRAVIVADRGREADVQRALRRMRVINYIPSNRGRWEDGALSKNIVVQRIIEDPIFRNSAHSYFLQLADAAAFALLKREVPPTSNVAKYGIDKMFDECLSRVCNTKAHKDDPLGIVRK